MTGRSASGRRRQCSSAAWMLARKRAASAPTVRARSVLPRRERRRQRAELGDQGVGPGGGVGGPGGPEERVQEGSAPFLISRRWWA